MSINSLTTKRSENAQKEDAKKSYLRKKEQKYNALFNATIYLPAILRISI